MRRCFKVSFPLLVVVVTATAGCTSAPPKGAAEPPAILSRRMGPAASPSDPAAADSRAAGSPRQERTSGKTIELRAYRFGLDQAIEWALMHNLSLMNAHDQVARSRFDVRTAASAFEVKVIPSANASVGGGSGGTGADRGAGIGLTKKTAIGTQLRVSGDTAKAGDTYTTGAAFELTQPLLRGLGRETNIDALLDARFGLLSSERSLLEFKDTLVLSVVRSFYGIIREREVLQLNEKSAERTRKHLKAAEARERVGLASRIDVLRAGIQLRQAEDNLLAAHERFGDALDRFRILLGFGPQEDVEIDSDLSYREFEVDTETVLLLAMTNRVDLAQARDRIDEAQRNLRIARNNTLPQLDLVLGYQRFGTGTSFSGSSGLSDYTWTVGLATSTDISRTAERARHEQAKLDGAATKRNYQLLKDTVVREVKDALRRLEKNRKRIGIQEADVALAQQKLSLAKVKFDRGLADNFDLIDAEEEIIRAKTNHISAVTDYIVSQAELKKAIGTLIQKPPRLLQ